MCVCVRVCVCGCAGMEAPVAIIVVVIDADDERHHLCPPAAVRIPSQVRPPVLSVHWVRDIHRRLRVRCADFPAHRCCGPC